MRRIPERELAGADEDVPRAVRKPPLPLQDKEDPRRSAPRFPKLFATTSPRKGGHTRTTEPPPELADVDEPIPENRPYRAAVCPKLRGWHYPAIKTTDKALSRTECTGPSNDPLCITAKNELQNYGFYARHYMSTEIVSGGDWNSLAEISRSDSIFGNENVTSIAVATESRGPHARAERVTEKWFTSIDQGCASHLGHRRPLTPIAFITTEWRPGLLPVPCNSGIITGDRPPEYPEQPLTCNGSYTDSVIGCSVPGLFQASWKVSGQSRSEFASRPAMSFRCSPGASYNVSVQGVVLNNDPYQASVTVRCRSTTR